MPRVIQAAEFFVVGGPVQPDRLCYVERPADAKSMAALAARKHCYVLGPPAIGKSSLMGRLAKAVRQRGELAAVVDLAQLQARGESDDANRWIYGIAHKVVHELRLQVDLQTWWQEANALAREHRLADFFWEIVLTNTTAPITVFIDDIEICAGLPFGRELLAALRECRARRSSESDFARLCFVVLGAASLRELAAEGDGSTPAAEIELGDFTAEEAYRLAIGLGGEQTQSQALMDRICVWTNGHPYFTQKVARAVARKGGKLEDVERVVREQLLVPTALAEEPPLRHARALLTSRTPAARQALKVMRRVARGGKVAPPRDAAVLDLLRLAGPVGLDGGGALRYRNRIFKEQLGARWLKAAAPARGRTWALAASLVLAAGAAGYWYTQYAPLPYIRTLSAADVDPDTATEAYGRLRRLPGFAARADQLLGDALIRRSGTADNLAAALATDARLRQLPGLASRADTLLADFWLRQSDLAARAERRDDALLLALRAAATDAANADARARAAELVGDDYRALVRSTRLAATPAHWTVDWPRQTLLSVDAERNLERTPLTAANATAVPAVPLTALRHTALARSLRVGSEGSAGAFQLTLAVRHAASPDVQVTLAAPSGAQATFQLPQSEGDRAEDYVFSAAEGSPLAGLADEGQRGVWRLTLVDLRIDDSGVLFDWGLRFGDDVWSDDPEQPLDIPEPSRTGDVTVAPAAEFAVVQPAAASGVGTVALWNLVEGRLQGDFTSPAAPRHVELNATATRLVAVAATSVTLFNVADGSAVARLATQTELALPPVFSADGGYLAIAERVEGAPLYSLLSSVDGALLASVEGVADARTWLLGPGARYLALLAAPTLVRVLDPRRGTELARFAHAAEVQRLLPLVDGSMLLTIDARGDIRAWNVGAGRAASANGRLLGTTVDAAGASVSADGTRLAYTAAAGEVVVRDVATGASLYVLRLSRATPVTATQLSPNGSQLVTAAGGRFRWWALDDAGPARAAPADVTAVALDRDADVAAIGFRAGELVAGSPEQIDLARAALGYFGHGGAVTSAAVNAAHGLVATGGADGAARVWALATVAPAGEPLWHSPRAPVAAVGLSADGRWLASGAGDSARVWNVVDGTSAAEIAVSGGVSAIAWGGDVVAVGDGAGQVTLAPLGAGGPRRVLRIGAPLTALAFAPNGTVLATADVTGGVRLFRPADGAPLGEARRLAAAVRWLDFDTTSGVLLAATDDWFHSFAVAPDLAPLHSRLAPWRLERAGLAAAGGERVRVTGFDARAALSSTVVDLAAATAPASVPERDWTAALGLKLDAGGAVVTVDF